MGILDRISEGMKTVLDRGVPGAPGMPGTSGAMAAPLSDRRVGLQSLEPLAERRRHRHPPHERPAALAADDLAALLQPPQGAAQCAP